MRKLFVIAIAIFSCLYACTKIDSTIIGSDLIPPGYRVNTIDTILNVETSNFLEENTPRVYKTNDHVIGAITNDPLFGNTTASAYFQLKPATYPFYFPGKKVDLTVDSAVLVLSYKGVFGDTTIPQTWNVYEVDKNSEFRYDSAYPVNTKIPAASLLGTKSLDIRTFNDSIRYPFDSSINQIRIRLDGNFARRFIKDYDTTSTGGLTNAYQNDSLFREKFAGFAVVPQGNGNALIRVNLTAIKLQIHPPEKME